MSVVGDSDSNTDSVESIIETDSSNDNNNNNNNNNTDGNGNIITNGNNTLSDNDGVFDDEYTSTTTNTTNTTIDNSNSKSYSLYNYTDNIYNNGSNINSNNNNNNINNNNNSIYYDTILNNLPNSIFKYNNKFFGNKILIKRIINSFKNNFVKTCLNVLIGYKGMGKTKIINEICYRLMSGSHNYSNNINTILYVPLLKLTKNNNNICNNYISCLNYQILNSNNFIDLIKTNYNVNINNIYKNINKYDLYKLLCKTNKLGKILIIIFENMDKLIYII